MTGEAAEKRCPVCGSARCSALYRWSRGFEVWRCSVCGLLYSEPLPDEQELADYYRDLSRTEGEPGHMRRQDDLDRRLAAVREAVSRYFELACEITGADRIRRVLDVGGGLGLYSKACESLGADAQYVEIDQESVLFAKERLGLRRVTEADVSTVRDRVEGTFDLVLCRHVIEHVRDPDALVGQLASVVRPGGTVVLETPNADNREQWAHPGVLRVHTRILRRENPGLTGVRRLTIALGKPLSAATPPKHLYGFNAENLTMLLRRHQLEPGRRIITVCGDPVFDPLYYWGDRRERGLKHALYRRYERIASAVVRLTSRGSHLALFAQRIGQ